MFQQTPVKVWNFPLDIQKGVFFLASSKSHFGTPSFSLLLFVALSVDPLLAAGTILLGEIQTLT